MKAFSLFLSGMFFGGTIDHVILALMGKTETPYGIECGQYGNWLYALLDTIIAGILLMVYKRKRRGL